MKIFLLAAAISVLSFNTLHAQETRVTSGLRKLPYWQDLNVVQVNKEYPRTQFMTYDSRQDALQSRFEQSKYYLSLNGIWEFYFVNGYKNLPENITDSIVSLTGWKDIRVPGNREIQGFGIPILRDSSV
jgi:beta-galactosidase